MKNVLNVRLEKLSVVNLCIGILFILCGILAFTKKPIVGFLFILSGIGILTGYKGASLDKKQNRVRQLISIFGLKFGDWKSMKNYSFILISIGGSATGRRSANGMYQLYLVPFDKNKHRSLPLCNSFDLKYIEQLSHKYADFMSLEIKSNLNARKAEDVKKS